MAILSHPFQLNLGKLIHLHPCPDILPHAPLCGGECANPMTGNIGIRSKFESIFLRRTLYLGCHYYLDMPEAAFEPQRPFNASRFN
jgi:hypothetical protein